MNCLKEQAALAGYGVFALAGDDVFALRIELRDLAGRLESYAPEDFGGRNVEIVKAFHRLEHWKAILGQNRAQLEAVVGAELMYQREPYMRILRTGRLEDSVGIHRDTHYGASLDEWVLWIPLTHAINGAELTILPGSHLKPEDAYPWTQQQGDCERGSERHWLGFMWAPKRMDKSVEDQCVPVPCRVGEAILFNTNCVHGIKVNQAPWTRWSIDIRLVEAAKVRQRGVHGEMFERL